MDEEYLNYGLGEQPVGTEIQLPEQVQAVNPEDQQYYVGNKGGSSNKNPYLSKIFGNISDSIYNKKKDTAEYIWKYFHKKGLNDYQIAGILGKMMIETTIDTNKNNVI